MKGLRFDVRQPNGATEVVLVDGATARIGHAAHCEVRLALDQAAPEHILIEGAGDQLRARAIASPAPTVNGAPLTKAPFLSGSIIELDGIQITVTAVADDSVATGSGKRLKLFLGLGAVLAGLAMVLLQTADDDSEKPREDPKADLFADPPTRCPYANQAEAMAFARDQMSIGEARSLRQPFAPREGAAAVAAYDLAAVCFQTADRGDIARGVAILSGELRAQIIADFRARSLRLEYSVRAKDNELVQTDLAALLALTGDRGGPYFEYLVQLARAQKQSGEEAK